MTITATLDHTGGRLHTRVQGILHYNDFLLHLKETRRLLAPGCPELFEARFVRTDLTTVQVRALSYAACEVSARGELGPTAFVVTDNALYGMARMYSSFCDGACDPIRVFRELGCAAEWLETLESRAPNSKATQLSKRVLAKASALSIAE